MADNLKNDIKFVPYKDIVKKRALEYYNANKEAISQKRKDKYKLLPPEEKKRLQQNNKHLLDSQTPEEQQEMRIKARKYHKNRYENMMIAVKYQKIMLKIMF